MSAVELFGALLMTCSMAVNRLKIKDLISLFHKFSKLSG